MLRKKSRKGFQEEDSQPDLKHVSGETATTYMQQRA